MSTEPAVEIWAQAVHVRRRAHRKPLPPFTPCSRSHRSCSPAHAALVGEYRDARDARNAIRGSDAPVPAAFAHGARVTFMQLEDDDFDRAYPPVTFKDWLVGHVSRQREEDAA